MSHPDLPEIPDKPLGSTPAPATSAAGGEWGIVYNDFQGHWEVIASDGRVIIDEIGEFRFADDKSRKEAAKRLALSIRDNFNASLAALREQHEDDKRYVQDINRENLDLRQQLATAQKEASETQAALKRANELGCTVAENGKWTEEEWSEHQRITRQPDRSALNAVIEAATAPLQEALKLVLLFYSVGEWSQEKCNQWASGLNLLLGGVETRDVQVVGDNKDGTWDGAKPCNEATTKNLCNAVRAALASTRNLSLDSPSQQMTGVGANAKSASTGAPSGQTAGVASQKAGQPKMKRYDDDYEALSNMPEWEDGMNAALGGMASVANPHPPSSDEWRAWNLGFQETNEEEAGHAR